MSPCFNHYTLQGENVFLTKNETYINLWVQTWIFWKLFNYISIWWNISNRFFHRRGSQFPMNSTPTRCTYWDLFSKREEEEKKEGGKWKEDNHVFLRLQFLPWHLSYPQRNQNYGMMPHKGAAGYHRELKNVLVQIYLKDYFMVTTWGHLSEYFQLFRDIKPIVLGTLTSQVCERKDNYFKEQVSHPPESRQDPFSFQADRNHKEVSFGRRWGRFI